MKHHDGNVTHNQEKIYQQNYVQMMNKTELADMFQALKENRNLYNREMKSQKKIKWKFRVLSKKSKIKFSLDVLNRLETAEK